MGLSLISYSLPLRDIGSVNLIKVVSVDVLQATKYLLLGQLKTGIKTQIGKQLKTRKELFHSKQNKILCVFETQAVSGLQLYM